LRASGPVQPGTYTFSHDLARHAHSMITGELKSKIDRIWDMMWSGVLSLAASLL